MEPVLIDAGRRRSQGTGTGPPAAAAACLAYEERRIRTVVVRLYLWQGVRRKRWKVGADIAVLVDDHSSAPERGITVLVDARHDLR